MHMDTHTHTQKTQMCTHKGMTDTMQTNRHIHMDRHRHRQQTGQELDNYSRLDHRSASGRIPCHRSMIWTSFHIQHLHHLLLLMSLRSFSPDSPDIYGVSERRKTKTSSSSTISLCTEIIIIIIIISLLAAMGRMYHLHCPQSPIYSMSFQVRSCPHYCLSSTVWSLPILISSLFLYHE